MEEISEDLLYMNRNAMKDILDEKHSDKDTKWNKMKIINVAKTSKNIVDSNNTSMMDDWGNDYGLQIKWAEMILIWRYFPMPLRKK